MRGGLAPGLYPDLPAGEYHAEPALSSTGARTILDSPARFAYEREHPRQSATFDFGSAAHKLILGDESARLRVVDADSWRSREAREERDAAYAVGDIPILIAEHGVVLAMEDAIRRHPVAGALLASGGQVEQSLVWLDVESGVMRRARPDLITHTSDGRTLIVDYKTARSAAPRAFSRAAYDYGYHQQDAWYRDGVTACGLGDEPGFVFIVQEKAPPHLVSVIELDPVAVRIGDERNRRAITTYQHCLQTGTWPGYSDEIEMVPLPRWAEIEHEETYP